MLMRRESRFMKALAEKSTQEAHTMKTVTLVIFVYLPASFTAVSMATLSSPVSHADSNTGVLQYGFHPY